MSKGWKGKKIYFTFKQIKKNMSYNLSEKFNDFKIPEDILGQVKMGLITIPKNMLKMVLFAGENKLTNQDIDYWMAIKPERQSEEDFSAYKARQKFQSSLVKYRPYLYDYSENIEIV